MPDVCCSAEAQGAEAVLHKPFLGYDVDHHAYERIGTILREQQNFSLDGYKEISIKRRVAARIRAAGFQSAEGYLELLEGDSEEQQRLLTALSIHVSQFFRNPTAFSLLAKKVIPELIDIARSGSSKLRLWSVGCAYGEEPYTLALICREQIVRQDSLAIIGTDVSGAALKKARQGRYPVDRLGGLSPEVLKTCFSREGNDYRLNKEIRNTVQFFKHDILTDPPFYRADLILCRNLLIYFSRDQQRKIIEMLASALLPGGYLMLGRAETLAPDCRRLFSCKDPAERIYQRTAVVSEQS